MNNANTTGGEISFEAHSEEEAMKHLRRQCNDGRCWLITVVFGSVRAYPYGRARFPIDDIIAAERNKYRYWRDGAWHRIDQARIDAAERKAWDEAINASNCRD